MRAAPPGGRLLSARAYRLPGPPVAGHRERFGSLSLEVPDLETADVSDLLAGLREKGRGLSSIDHETRCRALARAAARFLDPTDSLRRRAEELLPAATGFSPPVIREGLQRGFSAVTYEALSSLSADAATPHELVAVISAGNVPAVFLQKTVLALACGAAVLVKTAAGEPVLAPLFAEALAEACPAVGAALAVLWWPGGASAWEAEVLTGVDAVVAYGSNEALASIEALRPRSLVAHGHRVSAAVARLGVLPPERIAEATALDVALYDQLGCLSPQCVYGIGSPGEREVFAAALAESLGRLARTLPRGEMPAGAESAIRRLRDEVEWREIRGEDVRLFPGDDFGFTVVRDTSPRFRPSPLHRTVFVLPLESAAGLGEALGEARGVVECLGVDPFPDAAIVASAKRCGVPRVVPSGEMQRPGLDWSQGGRSPLAGIVKERT